MVPAAPPIERWGNMRTITIFIARNVGNEDGGSLPSVQAKDLWEKGGGKNNHGVLASVKKRLKQSGSPSNSNLRTQPPKGQPTKSLDCRRL